MLIIGTKFVDLDFKNMLDNYPFLSYLTYGGIDYIGVIQNHDDIVTSLYDFSMIKKAEDRLKYLELADQWWWESSRLVPINIFLKADWSVFRYTLKTFNSKEVDLKHGPYISLKEIASKRPKKKSITLVRKI